MPGEPNWSAYAGYWVALVRGAIVACGRTRREAFLAARESRCREEPEVVYVSSDGKPVGKGPSLSGEEAPPFSVFPRPPLASFGSESSDVPALIARIAHMLRSLGAEGYFVGGTVRDMLLRRETHDVDVALEGDVFALARTLADRMEGAYYPLDEERGVARVVFAGEEARANIDIARMRGGGIAEDLRLRDFTVNALALPLDDLRREAILDPTGGIRDLQEGILRAVSERSFSDDPVRLIRAVRLAGALSLALDDATEERLRVQASLLPSASPERVRDELNLMLALPRAGCFLREMEHLGLLRFVIPQLDDLRGLEQPPPHVWDGFEHTLRAVDAVDDLILALRGGQSGVPPEMLGDDFLSLKDDLLSYLAWELSPGQSRLIVLRLAALLHDIGKPSARTQEAGRIRFLDHPAVGARLAAGVLRNLRYSGSAVQMAVVLIREHMRLLSLMRAQTVTRRALYRYCKALGDSVPAAGLLFLADILATRPVEQDPQWRKALRVATNVLGVYFREPEIVSPKPLISGRDIMETLNLEEGPAIGRLLEAVLEAQAEGSVRTRDEALACAAAAWAKWKGNRHGAR